MAISILPARAQPLMQASRQLQLGTRSLSYQLQRSARRSIGFQISEQGLRVSAPSWISIAEIEQAILSKQNWILSKLALREQLSVKSQAMQWQDGATMPYLGRSIQLQVILSPGLPAVLDASGTQLILHFAKQPTAEKIRQRVHTWLQAQAEHVFLQKLHHYAAAMGVQFAALSLSSARTQWGSCSAQGNIRLNWRLMHFSNELIDYVVVHELAHRREMNHSPRFWAEVAAYFPDYKMARSRLQQASRALPQGI